MSIIGTARADTPLLDQPLAGKVFFARTASASPLRACADTASTRSRCARLEGTLALVLDRHAIELSKAGKRRQGDATTTDLDVNALIRSDGAQQHVAARTTAAFR